MEVNEDGSVRLPIEKAGSRLIVFERLKGDGCTQGKDPGVTASKLDIREETTNITRWDIRLDKVDGTSLTLEDSPLFDLSKDERTSDFAGVITYSAEIQVVPGESRYIDLGNVYGVSEVFVNGVSLGVEWYGGRVSVIPGELLQSGTVNVTVKVTTTLGNYMKSLSDNPTARRWTSGQALQPTGMIGPVSI